MPKVSAKRQITLPQNQCRILNIEPGDEVESFVFNNHLTIIKKVKGAADGLISHIRGDNTVTDNQSLQDGIK